MKLVESAQTYRDASHHADFVRGVMAAYNADLSISFQTYQEFQRSLDSIMEVKRKLPIERGTL